MTFVAPDTVEYARELIMPMLREMVNRLASGSRLAISYHFGWRDEERCPANVNGGKAIRPALTLLGAEACGVDPQMALPAAAAVELVHEFSLVHDDLMDRDAPRRHRATVWAEYSSAWHATRVRCCLRPGERTPERARDLRSLVELGGCRMDVAG